MGGCIKSWMVLGVMATAGATSASAGLVGHWNFNEGSGTTATDVSGNSHNGAISGASYVAGPIGFGTALQFNDSEQDYVNVGGTGTALQLVGSNYTLAWWMNWSGAGVNAAAQRIVNMDDGQNASGGYSALLLKPGATYHYYATHYNNGNGDANNYFPGLQGPISGVWTHVAVVRDGVLRKFYLDGVYVGSTAHTAGDLSSDGDDPLTFGALFNSANPGGIQFFNGALDDIRLYNHALTDSEVAALLVPEPASVTLLGLGLFCLKADWREGR